MSWDNDSTPTVRIQGEDQYSKTMDNLARSLRDMGDIEGAKSVLADKHRLKINTAKSIEKIATDGKSKAQELIKERQYKSDSGYEGDGTLWRSIVVDKDNDGMTAEYHPTATSKEGYEYGQAFEFGLKSKNYPAQHPMLDSASDLEDKHSEDAINNSIK